MAEREAACSGVAEARLAPFLAARTRVKCPKNKRFLVSIKPFSDEDNR
jgi:hypothetical protein